MKRDYVFHNQAHHPNESYCSRERIWKPKSEFNYLDVEHGILQQVCRDCQQQQMRERYANNRNRVRTINKVSKLNTREESREFVYQYLCENPCVDCGESNPLVLTFDHVRGRKRGNVSDMIGNGWAIETIKIEMGKCVVVCFNCHMRRERNKR